ncbi:MAG: Stp1/IreP family PP2C-type Ser/Thr phosphatase [Butyrivibrio sp.]|nr:Stp1/IreP family PP2C-type Ser/Thr phosphatase [Butyrivibrio sp.]
MKSSAFTDVGRKRKLNQDYIFTSEQSVGILPNLFIVADGMGGHRAGDFASRFTADTVVEELQKSCAGEPEELLARALTVANRKLRMRAAQDERMAGMGTTFVAACITGDRLLAANIGDSRLYVLSRGEITQITEDHSLVQEMVRMGGIDAETARSRTDKNIITRAVGAMENVEADFFRRTLRDGELVLLCSDGLTNMVEDTQIRRIAAGNTEAALDSRVQALVAAANEHGGRDNIAVILIDPFADGGVVV